MFLYVSQYDKATEYLQKALVITTEIGDKKGEARCYGNLGTVRSYGRTVVHPSFFGFMGYYYFV